jgi:hypothetical protein
MSMLFVGVPLLSRDAFANEPKMSLKFGAKQVIRCRLRYGW